MIGFPDLSRFRLNDGKKGSHILLPWVVQCNKKSWERREAITLFVENNTQGEIIEYIFACEGWPDD